MAKLSEEMREEMSKVKPFMLATASKDGVPNVVPIGMLSLQDDGETVWIVDNYMRKTLANVKENPRAAFTAYTPDGKLAFQVKGTVSVLTSGPDYEKAAKMAHERKKELPAKSLLVMKVTDVYSVKPGPDAGSRLL